MNWCREALTKERADSGSISCLLQKYGEIKSSEKECALILLNIKNFRFFNAKYGMKAGNEILKLVLREINAFLADGEYGTYLYADNFVLLLKYEDIHVLINERILPLTEKIYRIEDEKTYRNLFVSLGIYEIKDRTTEFYDALNYANLCRKESDALSNRSSCMEIYNEVYYDKYMKRMELEAETAVAHKNYEFVPYLQPKIDLKTGRIAGAEALIRWHDSDGNLIPVEKFLPILNQNSYIKLVDLDIFEQMCQYLDIRIKNSQKVVPISFNISQSYFYSANIFQDYIKVYEKFDIPIKYVQMELLESISLNDTEHMKKVIDAFKKYGFTCCLDDFGSGYSSFNVLLNAQLDIVKMDRQFFLNNLNGDAKLVIKTVVDLIHSLNMKVVAEGVESEEQIKYLKTCGCDYVQSYYYYKPMSVEEFNELLDSQM